MLTGGVPVRGAPVDMGSVAREQKLTSQDNIGGSNEYCAVEKPKSLPTSPQHSRGQEVTISPYLNIVKDFLPLSAANLTFWWTSSQLRSRFSVDELLP